MSNDNRVGLEKLTSTQILNFQFYVEARGFLNY